MAPLRKYCSSSIGKKQIVAVTGLALILFILGHLAGNLTIYGGPDLFNSYAEHLANLRPGLYVVEFALLWIFVTHVYFTALVVLENIRARAGSYLVQRPKGERSFATRLMPYTATIIFIFVGMHLMDFTFADHHGPLSVLADGQNYGLYGVVYNAFTDPLHSSLYIMAMFSLALHLHHGVESCIQTFGFNHPKYTPALKKFSGWFSLLIAVGYSSIPVYVLVLEASK